MEEKSRRKKSTRPVLWESMVLNIRVFPQKRNFTGENLIILKLNSVVPEAGTKVIDRGFFVQGGFFLIPKKFEVAGRYSLVDFDNSRVADATEGNYSRTQLVFFMVTEISSRLTGYELIMSCLM